MLADLGADVIKVEPPEGDITRLFGKRVNGLAGYYVQQNSGKRNISVDLSAAGATELLQELAATSDVVMENFRPGVMARYHLGWEDLHPVNPKLVMLSISGFGQTGPERDRAAYAPVVHAESGYLDRQAQIEGREAHDTVFSFADTYASLHGLVGLLSAVIMAQRTGRGTHIDLSMLNAMMVTDDYAHYIIEDEDFLPAAGRSWQVAGGPIVIAADISMLWRLLSRRKGLEDPTPDPARADIPTKRRYRGDAIAEYLASFETRDDVVALLDELNLAWGDVRPYRDIYDAPSIGPRRILTDVDDRGGGTRQTTQSPYHFSDAEAGVAGPPPYRGEHNRSAVQDWLIKSDAEIDGLIETGVLVAEERAIDLGR